MFKDEQFELTPSHSGIATQIHRVVITAAPMSGSGSHARSSERGRLDQGPPSNERGLTIPSMSRGGAKRLPPALRQGDVGCRWKSSGDTNSGVSIAIASPERATPGIGEIHDGRLGETVDLVTVTRIPKNGIHNHGGAGN